jgi:hypothetical protein
MRSPRLCAGRRSQPRSVTAHERSDNSLVRRQMLDIVDGVLEHAYMHTVAANRELAKLQTIRGAPDPQGSPIQNMRVNHRRADIRMAEQFLNRSNIVPVLEQKRRKGMAEGVAADPLRDPRPADRESDRALHDGFVQMKPGRWSEARVWQIRAAGNTNCQLHSVAALGYFRSSAAGSVTRPTPSDRSR